MQPRPPRTRDARPLTRAQTRTAHSLRRRIGPADNIVMGAIFGNDDRIWRYPLGDLSALTRTHPHADLGNERGYAVRFVVARAVHLGRDGHNLHSVIYISINDRIAPAQPAVTAFSIEHHRHARVQVPDITARICCKDGERELSQSPAKVKGMPSLRLM